MVQLDGLRAIAVLAVIAQHTLPMPAALNIGRLGVRLFFVLSGFLITGILLRSKVKSPDGPAKWYALRSFYVRRLLRIFPLYYLVIGVALVLALGPARAYVVSLLSYTSNLQGAAEGHFLAAPLGHFWSLAVEEQFYMLWPTFILFLPWRSLPYAVATMIVAGPISRFFVLRWTGNHVSAQLVTTSCLDTLGGGALLALLAHRDSLGSALRERLGWLCAVGGIALLAALVVMRVMNTGYTPYVVLEDTASTLMFVALVHRAATGFRGWAGGLLEWRPLVYVGTISYGVYVFHNIVPTAALLPQRLGISLALPTGEGLGMFLFVTVVTITLATISWWLFERPVNRLKEYFPYATKQGVPSAGHSANRSLDPAKHTGGRSPVTMAHEL
jgi:peptidoglycan/LPS O-acetylase OafA/YrhL